MGKKVTFKGIIEVFKNAFGGFGDDKVTKLSGSLAYYTAFSQKHFTLITLLVLVVYLRSSLVV